jgi:hypothetical protein
MSLSQASPSDQAENPYAAPEVELSGPLVAAIGDLAMTETESIRHAHLTHESIIRLLGSLTCLAGAALVAFGATALGLSILATFNPNLADLDEDGMLWTKTFSGLILCQGVIVIGIGLGLRQLRPWARWTESALMALQIVSTVYAQALLGAVVAVYILYVLHSARGRIVFSPRYQDAMVLTPHIRYRFIQWVKLAATFCLLIVAGAVIISLIIYMFQRP